MEGATGVPPVVAKLLTITITARKNVVDIVSMAEDGLSRTSVALVQGWVTLADTGRGGTTWGWESYASPKK